MTEHLDPELMSPDARRALAFLYSESGGVAPQPEQTHTGDIPGMDAEIAGAPAEDAERHDAPRRLVSGGRLLVGAIVVASVASFVAHGKGWLGPDSRRDGSDTAQQIVAASVTPVPSRVVTAPKPRAAQRVRAPKHVKHEAIRHTTSTQPPATAIRYVPVAPRVQPVKAPETARRPVVEKPASAPAITGGASPNQAKATPEKKATPGQTGGVTFGSESASAQGGASPYVSSGH